MKTLQLYSFWAFIIWYLEIFFSSTSFGCPWLSNDKIQKINIKAKMDLSFLSFQQTNFTQSWVEDLMLCDCLYFQEDSHEFFTHLPQFDTEALLGAAIRTRL